MKTSPPYPAARRLCLAGLLALATCASAPAASPLQNVMNFSLSQTHALGAPLPAGDGNYYVATSNGGDHLKGSIVRVTPGGEVATIHSFTGGADESPLTPLALGPDGALYGDTYSTLFRVTTAGAYQKLADFDYQTQGANPQGAPLVASDGAVYLAASNGGPGDVGTLLKWTSAGGLTVLAAPGGPEYLDLSGPTTGLWRDADGNLYGSAMTHSYDPDFGALKDVIFKYSAADGLVLLAILDSATMGRDLIYNSSPVPGPDGKLYFTTDFVAANGHGAVFRVDTATGAVEVVHAFADSDGRPTAAPVFGADGSLYGLNAGGPDEAGVFYRLTTAGQFTALNTFSGQTSAVYAEGGPLAPLTGGTFIGAGSSIPQHPEGDPIFTLDGATGAGTVLAALPYFSPFGAFPRPALALAPDGGVYGVAGEGGSLNHGTLFHAIPASQAETLYDFPISTPLAGLAKGMDGKYYGETISALFRYTPGEADLEVVASGEFPAQPRLPLPAADGAFYGSVGGSLYGSGAIYKASSTEGIAVIASFDYNTTGFDPNGPLTIGPDGNYYGVTTWGGAHDSGTVFKVTPSGTLTALASLDGIAGGNPSGPLALAGDGNLYGVTEFGGGTNNNNRGAIFRVVPATGALSLVAVFDYETQGGFPNAGLTLGDDGLLYGTTLGGGAYDGGTLFKSTLDGHITVLANFDRNENGDHPGPVLQAPDGSLYVALNDHGPGGAGAIVRYDPASAPTPTPTPAPPPPAPKVIGKPKIKGSKATVSGTLSPPGAYVEYSATKAGKYKKVKANGGKWKITFKLKPGRNVFYIRAFDPATGGLSAPRKITIVRKSNHGRDEGREKVFMPFIVQNPR